MRANENPLEIFVQVLLLLFVATQRSWICEKQNERAKDLFIFILLAIDFCNLLYVTTVRLEFRSNNTNKWTVTSVSFFEFSFWY